MIITFTYQNKNYQADLSKPLDISIPIKASDKNVNAWYIDPPKIEPVTDKDWIGKVSEGASTNFNNIYFNPHAHGTHTECVGHITSEFHSVNSTLKEFFFIAELVTVEPEPHKTDFVITEKLLKTKVIHNTEALILRTLPNKEEKLSKQYSHTNWPYLTENAVNYIRNMGVNHLLTDQPSIDKEKDDGKLVAHKTFWNYPDARRRHATITEMIYAKDAIEDGIYLLNLQIAPFENDASPSKPVLYKIIKL